MSLPTDGDMRWKHFAVSMRQRESSGDYSAVNTIGYLGAYQFGMARLCDLGYTTRVAEGCSNNSFAWKPPWSRDLFLADVVEQDRAFRAHMEQLARSIERRNWADHLGQPMVAYREGEEGEVTLSGLLGVAHLLGLGGLGKMLAGDDDVDGYGTRGSDYLVLFNGWF